MNRSVRPIAVSCSLGNSRNSGWVKISKIYGHHLNHLCGILVRNGCKKGRSSKKAKRLELIDQLVSNSGLAHPSRAMKPEGKFLGVLDPTQDVVDDIKAAASKIFIPGRNVGWMLWKTIEQGNI